MGTSLTPIEEVARGLDRSLTALAVISVVLLVIFLTILDPAGLYFSFRVPFGLPYDVGGFPIVAWVLALFPVGVILAAKLQLPLVTFAVAAARGVAGELTPDLRASSKASARLVAWLGLMIFVVGLFRQPVLLAAGAIMLVESVVVVGLVRREARRAAPPMKEQVAGSKRRPGWGRGLLQGSGRQAVFITILAFGCVSDQVPSSRVWGDLQRDLETLGYNQERFFGDNDRYARHLSEAGWAASNPSAEAEMVSDADGFTATLMIGDEGPYRGFRGEIRCTVSGGTHAGLERGLVSQPTCHPPTPRSGIRGDIGPFWVVFTDGFLTWWVAVPTLVASVLLGARFALVRRVRGA